MSEFNGSKKSVGFGLEATPGTLVAPTHWPRHMQLGFMRKNTSIDNESSMGRVETANDSAVVEQWAEGPFGGKVYDLTIGVLLANMTGAPVTSDNADTNPVVKDHTGNISQGNVAKTMTVVRLDPNSTRRHGLGTLENLEFESGQADWVKVAGNLRALPGITAADIASYAVVENSFTSKHTSVKIASAVGGLGAATALATASLKMNISRGLKPFIPHGTTEPTAFYTLRYKVEGEITLMYDSTALEDLWYNNTQRAMQIAFVNNDVTIGASARPGLVFTLPKVRLNTFDMSDDPDEMVEQTIGFKGELDISLGYMLRWVLTNTQASY